MVNSRARKGGSLSVELPSKRIHEKFLIVYELKGCQKAVNLLTKYYGVRNMKIILDGRKVPKECTAVYFRNKAWFKKEGLKKRIILHELYHHIIETKGLELPTYKEEKEANTFASGFLKNKLPVF
jgi:hypothetical protein